ncbi:MAG: hypothetical protein CMJ19_23150 [Phycisphaeraceae bacterium]|nr:hypothetical protein [Phycisphaeraceae bacterium]
MENQQEKTPMERNNPKELNGDILAVADVPDMLGMVITDAVKQQATDIHIDPHGEKIRIRIRVDGVIHSHDILSWEQGRRLINQIKSTAKLDIDAAYNTKEGHFRWGGYHHNGQTKIRDIRVTLMPTSPRGESAHLRMLMRPEEWMTIDQLGLSTEHQKQIHELVEDPRGLVLVAGPTGAGKTTTLYATAGLEGLAELVTVSIEDPVEYDLEFVRQVQVDEHHGLTMAQGLKSLLRMDADSILIGEIRDAESAQIAAHAGLAGRLVLSTIHARDAAAAIEAMHFLGVPDYVLGSSLRMVISQNLVRRLCGTCCREVPPYQAMRALFEHYQIKVPPIVCQAVGCDACYDRGYRHRTGVFEVVPIDDGMGQWLINGPRRHAIRQHLMDQGMQPLAVDALNKVAKGTVSMDEVKRLIGMSLAMNNHDHQNVNSQSEKQVDLHHHSRTLAVSKH